MFDFNLHLKAKPLSDEMHRIWCPYDEFEVVSEITPRLNMPFRIYDCSIDNVWINSDKPDTYGLYHLEFDVPEGGSPNFIVNLYLGHYIDGTSFIIGTKTMNAPYLLHEHDKLNEILECAKKVWVIMTSEDNYYAPNWKLDEPDWETINPMSALRNFFESFSNKDDD